MRLRQLFEATADEVAIIFGRFNPPHKGHRAAWELASQSSAWFVGTNESTVGPKDPLPYDVKVEAMKAIWPEVEGHIMAETSWLTMASELYKKYPDATLLCLTDEDWVTKTIVQYNGKEGAHGFYNFKNIEQKPTPRLSSATALRDAVTKGDRDAFTQAAGVNADTPVAGKPFFDLVAEYLLPYSNAPKKVTKKKEPAVAEGNDDDVWGPQGRFAGDVPVNVGGAVANRLDVDDVVSYFGEKATILAMSKDRTVSRIDLKSGITQNVKTSDLKRVGRGVSEGVPQPGPSSGAPKQFGPDAKIETRQMTVKDIISSVPGVPYYNNVVDDWDAKDYSWGVTKKVIEYATYLKDHPESLAKLPPAIVLNGKFEDGAHRVSAIWLLQQRMDPKNPLWKSAKLNVQFVKQGVAEVSKATIDRYVAKASDAHGDADFKARMSKHDPDKRSYHVDQKKTAEKRRQGISRALDRMSREGVAEGSAHGYNVVKWYEKWNDQKKLVKWLRKEAGLPNDDDIYFDDADLVYGDKTIVRDALVDPNLKFIDLLNAVAQATGGRSKQKVQGVYREQGVAEDGSNAMADTAKRLANKDDGKVAKLRAAGDKRREDQLKYRNIAKRNESTD